VIGIFESRNVRLGRAGALCISSMEAGNAFCGEFIEDYNRRFGREPMNPHDAHRPLQRGEDLSRIFTWQEERTMTRNLVVHFRRSTCLIVPSGLLPEHHTHHRAARSPYAHAPVTR